MDDNRETAVLVVGGGPVGMFTALRLSRAGVAVRLIDREWRIGAHSYALCLHTGTLRLLAESDCREVLAAGQRIGAMRFYDGHQPRLRVDLARLDDQWPFVLTIGQDQLASLLESKLHERNLPVEWNRGLSSLHIDSDRVRCRIEHWRRAPRGYAIAAGEWSVERTSDLDAAYVVGADGHRSAVRSALEIDFETAGPIQNFAVFEFKSNAGPADEAIVVLDRSGTSVLWPLPNGYRRWSFQMADMELPAESRLKVRGGGQGGIQTFPHVGREDLARLIAGRAPWFQGSVGEINWSGLVRFERRLAMSLGRGRCWLAGDAAHMASPVGVQSMNGGMQEGAELAECLQNVLRGQRSAEVLETYGRRRLAEWRTMTCVDASPAGAQGADPWVAANAASIATSLPACGQDLAALLAQVNLRLPRADAR
jgi:2-polyprenyl-6-methoxyphenol hydroxylase-like FAD-dependent oxidoreductase